MKHRIIWVIDSLRPGGAEQLMPALLNHFNRELFEMRVCVLQVKNGNPISNELEEIGIPVDLVQTNSLKNPFNIIKMLQYFKAHSPDLIHTQLEFSDILGNIAAKIFHKPSVSTLHTLDVVKKHKFSAPRQRLKWLVLNLFCDQVIAVSNKTRDHHLQVGRLQKDKVKTIYNGIQLSRFQMRDKIKLDAIKRELKINPIDKIITTVAVLRELKGIQYMVNALPEILKHHPNLTYLVVGDGEYAGSLRNFVAEHSLQNNVIFTGHRTDIPNMLALSDLFVHPSLGDALPTVLIEALAAGIPIVATNVGGIPEIIEDHVNGLLVPPGKTQDLIDTCLQVLENEDFSQRLANNGLDIVRRRFDVSVQAAQLENLYTELMNKYGN